MNKEYITASLCENRDKPKLHCNGKCHLKKQLNKADKKEKETSTILKDTSVHFFLCQTFDCLFYSVSPIEKTNDNYLLKTYTTVLSNVFHPPSV